MLVVNSRYPLTYDDDGGGIVFPLPFTFTLRPISGPFALITLVLEKLFYLHPNYRYKSHTFLSLLSTRSFIVSSTAIGRLVCLSRNIERVPTRLLLIRIFT